MKVSKELVCYGKVDRAREDPFRRGGKVLMPDEVIIVGVASFVFRFKSVEQLTKCLKFFEKKIHPTSRVSAKQLATELGEDWRELRGWEVERLV